MGFTANLVFAIRSKEFWVTFLPKVCRGKKETFLMTSPHSRVGQRQITQLEPVYFLSGSITCLDIM